MTTPPNTELKSAEELHHPPKFIATMRNIYGLGWKCGCSACCNVRSIQHNAMLAMAKEADEIVTNLSLSHDKRSGALSVRNSILTRAEQILKGEK